MPPEDTGHHNTSYGPEGPFVQARDIQNLTLNAPNAPPGTGAPDVSLDPPRLATTVRGRARLLETLHSAMEPGAPVPHVLTGPGGFGKTTVAAALAEHARAEGWRVFWVRTGDVSAGLLEAAVETGASRSEAEELRRSPRRAARWVWQHLDRAPQPWLLVLDNADRPEELDPHHRPGEQVGWLRSSPAGFVLVTSRVHDPALWAPAQVHEVGELDRAAAGAALADHAGREGLPGAEDLAERLGGVPLALALAGRIITAHRVLFPDALALLRRLEEDGVGGLDELAGPLVDEADAQRGLLSGVWKLSLELVAEREPKAPALLRLLALVGSQAMPVPLRRLAKEVLSGEPLCLGGEAELARTVNALVVHGLVSVGQHDDTVLRLHPLVSETLLAGMGEPEFALLDLAERLVEHQQDRDPFLEARTLAHTVRIRAQTFSTKKEVREKDIEGLNFRLERMTIAHKATLRAVTAGGRSLLLFGQPEETERHFADLLTDMKGTKYGEDPAFVIPVERLWAEARLHQGDLDTAEATYRRLLPEALEHLGPDDTETSDIRFQLALLSARREEWDAAREAFLREVEERARLHGPESVEVLRAKENLALIALERGHHATAAAGFEEVHALRAKQLGQGHPATAQIRHHQARLAYERGDLRLAHTWFTECLRVRERTLGEDSPATEGTRAWVEHTASRTAPAPERERPPRGHGASG